jgi:peptidoglycan/xylan/chitin deacetylase (PgdA/CDA1 family)
MENGAIILLHTGTLYTKEALPEIITRLKAKGYAFVPVSKLVYWNNYIVDFAGKQHKGK